MTLNFLKSYKVLKFTLYIHINIMKHLIISIFLLTFSFYLNVLIKLSLDLTNILLIT